MIEAGTWFRIFLCIVGILLFAQTLKLLAVRKLTEGFALFWGTLAVILIVMGLLIHPVLLHTYISTAGLILISLGVVCVLLGALFYSIQISFMSRRNRELAIDISLLHHENEKLQERLERLEEKETKE